MRVSNRCADLLYVFSGHVCGVKCLISYCDYLDDQYIFMELRSVFRIGVEAVLHNLGSSISGASGMCVHVLFY